MNYPLAPFLKRFFGHYLAVLKGLSPNTIAAYRDAIKLLLCYAADTRHRSVDELAVQAIDAPLVGQFLDSVEHERGDCTATRNARLAAIRSLFAFIAREQPELVQHCQQVRAIPLKRTTQKSVQYLEEQEMQAVLAAVDVGSRTGVRDQALLMLLYNTGARVSEVVGLRLQDLRLDGSPRVQLLGKGRKERACPLWPETAEALSTYLEQRIPKQPTAAVFLNTNGAPITRFGIRYITRKYGAKALPSSTQKSVNPHTVRHTAAMHMLRSGVDINSLSFWLGHADINTTHIYAEIDMEMKRRMIEKAGAPPIGQDAPWQQPDILAWLSQLGKASRLCGANLHAGR
jgi:site-specific recombinase XerD